MMSEMSSIGRGDEGDPGSLVPAQEGLRASHEDRDRVVELLRVAAGDGRLTAEELDERLEQALTARTHGELATLTRDLPAAPGAVSVAGTAGALQPKDLVRIECRSGSATRNGRWLVPKRMEIQLKSGNVTLDFTEAIITQPVLHIDASVRSGTLRMVTGPGVIVDVDEVSVRSGTVQVPSSPDPAMPAVFRIQISGSVASGTLKAGPPRPPRRSFWQWLLRRPKPAALPSPRP